MDRAQSADEAPLLTVLGERIALGPLRRDLLPLYVRWINDLGTLRTLGAPVRPITMEAEEAWYAAASKGDGHAFTIYLREDEHWRPIGNTELRDVDHRHRTATFGILIGEPDCRGKGYGTEATRLVLDYAFNALGLHNVMLTVYAFNHAGRRAYAKAGFREIGRRREARRRLGRAWDEILMDCLATEFESPVLRAALAPDDDVAQPADGGEASAEER